MPFLKVQSEGSRTVSHCWILALSLLATVPVAASAQFTTFIAPPNRVKDSIKAAVTAEQKAVADSITHAQVTDMKTWVDSAAGVAPVVTSSPVNGTDTTTVMTAMSNGVVAPATASPLPFALVVGGAAMMLGLALLRRPRRSRSQSAP